MAENVNSKEMQAFQAFLRQFRRFLSAALPWIVAVLNSRGLAQRPGGRGGPPGFTSAHEGIHPGAHRHLSAHQLSTLASVQASGRSRICGGCSLMLAQRCQLAVASLLGVLRLVSGAQDNKAAL